MQHRNHTMHSCLQTNYWNHRCQMLLGKQSLKFVFMVQETMDMNGFKRNCVNGGKITMQSECFSNVVRKKKWMVRILFRQLVCHLRAPLVSHSASIIFQLQDANCAGTRSVSLCKYLVFNWWHVTWMGCPFTCFTKFAQQYVYPLSFWGWCIGAAVVHMEAVLISC